MSFPHRLTEIDRLTQQDHSYLVPNDKCVFLGEYTARKGYAYSDTNNLILNLKKKPDRRGTPEWPHKNRAIQIAAEALKNSINDSWLTTATFVPIPPSKVKSDPLYDDRMTQVLAAINPNEPVDCRELIVQETSTPAVHELDIRPSPSDIKALYSLDSKLIEPYPSQIVICDDVVTTGAHFKAAQSILSLNFPEIPVVGCFIARRVPEAIDFDEFLKDLDE